MMHRYFNATTNANEFANGVIEKGGSAKVIPAKDWLSPVEVEWTPVSAHVRKDSSGVLGVVRAHKRRTNGGWVNGVGYAPTRAELNRERRG